MTKRHLVNLQWQPAIYRPGHKRAGHRNWGRVTDYRYFTELNDLAAAEPDRFTDLVKHSAELKAAALAQCAIDACKEAHAAACGCKRQICRQQHSAACKAATTAYKDYKSNALPWFTPSIRLALPVPVQLGRMPNGQEPPWFHSGLLFYDFDETHDRQALTADAYCYAWQASASGTGTHLFIKITPLPTTTDQHEAAYREVGAYLTERYGATFDDKCFNHNRLCFYTGNLVINDGAAVYAVDLDKAPPPEVTAERKARQAALIPRGEATGKFAELLKDLPYRETSAGYRIACPHGHRNDTSSCLVKLGDDNWPLAICLPTNANVTGLLYEAQGVTPPHERLQARLDEWLAPVKRLW